MHSIDLANHVFFPTPPPSNGLKKAKAYVIHTPIKSFASSWALFSLLLTPSRLPLRSSASSLICWTLPGIASVRSDYPQSPFLAAHQIIDQEIIIEFPQFSPSRASLSRNFMQNGQDLY